MELSSGSHLNEVSHGATRLQVRAMQDPLAGCHGGQILLVSQWTPYNDVGAAGVKRLLVQDDAPYRTKRQMDSVNYTW